MLLFVAIINFRLWSKQLYVKSAFVYWKLEQLGGFRCLGESLQRVRTYVTCNCMHLSLSSISCIFILLLVIL